MIRSSIVVVTWFSLHAIVNAGSPAGPPARMAGATWRSRNRSLAYPAWSTTLTASAGTITIKSAGVIQSPIYVGPDLPIFDQLNRGDTVSIRFYDSVIVAVTPDARSGAD